MKKNRFAQIRVNSDTYEAVKRLAKKRGMSFSEYARFMFTLEVRLQEIKREHDQLKLFDDKKSTIKEVGDFFNRLDSIITELKDADKFIDELVTTATDTAVYFLGKTGEKPKKRKGAST